MLCNASWEYKQDILFPGHSQYSLYAYCLILCLFIAIGALAACNTTTKLAVTLLGPQKNYINIYEELFSKMGCASLK